MPIIDRVLIADIPQGNHMAFVSDSQDVEPIKEFRVRCINPTFPGVSLFGRLAGHDRARCVGTAKVA